MHAWEQIQATVEYIEDHISEEIHIDELAKLASLSPFYYQRLFSRLVKKPVAEYIKLRRMAKATDDLLQEDKRILDIALDLGFTSHEHFTRTFKDTFGLTPDEYRKHPIALNRMTKPELLLHYVLIDEGVPLVTDGIVLEVNRKELLEPISFIGLKVDQPFEAAQGLGTESGVDPLDELWQNVHQAKTSILKNCVEEEELGVMYPCSKEGYYSYFGGAKSTHLNPPDNFTCWKLPAGNYIVCSFEAESFQALVMDALYKAEQYLYNIWLPKHNLKSDLFCAERYQSHTPETKNMELWLRLVP